MLIRETSIEAWESVKHFLGPVDAKIVHAIIESDGMTSDEVEHRLDLKHQTVSAQIRHLTEKRVLCPSGAKRKTRSGRNAIVWTLAEVQLRLF